MSVRAAIKIAQFFRTIITGPHGFADAGLSLQIEIPVAAAVRQALQCLLIHLTAIGTFPAFFTDACTFSAETVT